MPEKVCFDPEMGVFWCGTWFWSLNLLAQVHFEPYFPIVFAFAAFYDPP